MEFKELTAKEQKELVAQYARMSFSNLKRNILQDLINSKSESVIYKKYDKQRVISILENPQQNEKDIRELSNYLYITSSHYRRLVDYFSSILLYNYNVIPTRMPEKINKKEYKNTYLYVISECEKYNLRHEAIKSIKLATREGVFFGICFESEDSFYIKPVQSKYAQISGIEDGCYVFEFDLNFFNSNKDLLPMYGTEFEKAYEKYKGNADKGIKADKTKRWYEPTNGICIKADESDPYYSLPILTGLLTSVFDIEDYKMLKKAKSENDNYKALGLQLPTDEEGVPLLDFDINEQYFNHIVSNIGNSGIGVFMSPFKINDFSFASTAAADKNDVTEAEQALYDAAGVSGGLFLSNITSSSSITLSVKPDEQIAYSMLLQFQRYFNKKIKKMDLPYGFKIEFTAQSIFNNTEYVDRFAKASQYGLPVKQFYASSLGLSPSDMINLTYLEEDILGLATKKWTTPLMSSHTITSEEGGRPTNASQGKELKESGEQTKENDSNSNK